MAYPNKDELQMGFDLTVVDKSKEHIGIKYNNELNCFELFTAVEFDVELRRLGNAFAEGHFQVLPGHAREGERRGRKWYFLTVQRTWLANDLNTPCRLAMALGRYVYGITYAFSTLANCEAVYEYFVRRGASYQDGWVECWNAL
jgi:hypothetical protein